MKSLQPKRQKPIKTPRLMQTSWFQKNIAVFLWLESLITTPRPTVVFPVYADFVLTSDLRRLRYSGEWGKEVKYDTCHVILWYDRGLRQLALGRFRFPCWSGFWAHVITSSCVIRSHAFRLKFRRCKQTWKLSFWGWSLTSDHDVTFRCSYSGKHLW